MAKKKNPPRPDTRTSPEASLAPALTALVGAVALLSLLAHLFLSSAPGAWAVVGLGAGWLRHLLMGLVTATALVGALYTLERLDQSSAHRALRGTGVSTVLAALGLVFFLLGPESHIGDWQITLGVVLEGVPLGKWYGASVFLIVFDRWIGDPLGLTALQSIKLATSLLGACSAWVYYLTIREFELPRVLRAWPFLFLAGFGAIGVGLAHVEIYAVPVLGLGLTILTGLKVLRQDSPARMISFSLCAGLTLVSYLGMMLLLPAIAVIYLTLLRRVVANPSRARISAALLGLVLMVLPMLASQAAGPEPMDRSLVTFWAEQVTALDRERHIPCMLPQDVHWSPARNLIHPRHWLTGWHLGDISQFAFLGDRLGLLICCALAPLLWRRRKGREIGESLFLASTALIFLGFGATVCHGRTYPWDVDLVSCIFVPTSVLAAMLLARRSGATGFSRRFGQMLAAAGVVAFLGGYMLFASCAQPPLAFGPAQEGYSIAIEPNPLTIQAGTCTNIQVWIRNERSQAVTLEPTAIRVMVADPAGEWALTHGRGIQLVIGERILEPGEPVCHVNFDFSPGRLADNPLPTTGQHRARWFIQIDGAGDQLLNLRSGELSLDVRPGS